MKKHAITLALMLGKAWLSRGVGGGSGESPTPAYAGFSEPLYLTGITRIQRIFCYRLQLYFHAISALIHICYRPL